MRRSVPRRRSMRTSSHCPGDAGTRRAYGCPDAVDGGADTATSRSSRIGSAPHRYPRAVTRRRLTLHLVPLGVVLAHAVAYVLPHAEAANAPGHRHLTGFALVGVIAATVAFGSALIGSARGHHVEVSGGTLAGAQCVVYVVLELTEAMLNGSTLIDAASTSTLWTGLVLQLVVATALAGLLRATAAVGRWFAVTERPLWPSARVQHAKRTRMSSARRTASPASRRGPPVIIGSVT